MIKDIYVKEINKKGLGVFAAREFNKGGFIFRNRKGRIITRKDLPRLSKDDLRHLDEIDKNVWEIMKPPGRYVNHSCDPNTISKGSRCYALRKIKKDKEITADYRVNSYSNNKWKCYCGSKNCKGWVVSNFFTLDEKLQKKYLPYTLKFIREEYKRRQGIRKNPHGTVKKYKKCHGR